MAAQDPMTSRVEVCETRSEVLVHVAVDSQMLSKELEENKVIQNVVSKLSDYGYTAIMNRDLLNIEIAREREGSKNGRPYYGHDCIRGRKPASISYLTREMSFACGIQESARKVGKQIRGRFNLNAALFSRLYLDSIITHEVTHFLDLLNPSTCYFFSYAFQLILWIITAMTAKIGRKALLESYLMPNGNTLDLSTLIAMSQYSRLWTEARALYKQREFFKRFIHCREAQEFFRYFEWISKSDKPCEQLGVCDYHTLALAIIQEVEERFGSFDNIDAKIRNTIAVCDFGTAVPFARADVFSGDVNLIPLLVLGMEDNSFNNEDIETVCEIVNLKLPNFCSVEHPDSLLNKWRKRLHSEVENYLIPILEGKIHDTLMSMVLVWGSECRQTSSILCVEEEKWNKLGREEQQLCLDLFQLRLNLFSAIRCEVVRHCTRESYCPLLKLMRERELSSIPDLMRSFTVRTLPPSPENFKRITTLGSEIAERLERYYRNNRLVFKN